METFEHPFFVDFGEKVPTVASYAENLEFEAGQFIFQEGQPANQFYLLCHGAVALQLTWAGRGETIVQMVRDGEVFGLTCLAPPYHWTYDAKALQTTRVISLDATRLRHECEADHDFGHELMKRFVSALVERLDATRRQLPNSYGECPRRGDPCRSSGRSGRSPTLAYAQRQAPKHQ
jgi:CRP/FNR family cyclic AMP-dependent transcriptional regulator